MCRCVLVCGYTAALWGQRHLIPSEPFLPLVSRPLLRDWIVISLETRISLSLLCSLGYLKLPVIACLSFWVLGQQVWATALLLLPFERPLSVHVFIVKWQELMLLFLIFQNCFVLSFFPSLGATWRHNWDGFFLSFFLFHFLFFLRTQNPDSAQCQMLQQDLHFRTIVSWCICTLSKGEAGSQLF